MKASEGYSFTVLAGLVILFNFRSSPGKELQVERRAGAGRNEHRARSHGTGRVGRWTSSRRQAVQRARGGR